MAVAAQPGGQSEIPFTLDIPVRVNVAPSSCIPSLRLSRHLAAAPKKGVPGRWSIRYRT